MKNFNSSYEATKLLKVKYPNLDVVPVAAFGISHSYYLDSTCSQKIAETRYNGVKNDTFVGEGVNLIMLNGFSI